MTKFFLIVLITLSSNVFAIDSLNNTKYSLKMINQNQTELKEYIDAKTFNKKLNKVLSHILVDNYLHSLILLHASDDINIKIFTQIQRENHKKIQSILE